MALLREEVHDCTPCQCREYREVLGGRRNWSNGGCSLWNRIRSWYQGCNNPGDDVENDLLVDGCSVAEDEEATEKPSEESIKLSRLSVIEFTLDEHGRLVQGHE